MSIVSKVPQLLKTIRENEYETLLHKKAFDVHFEGKLKTFLETEVQSAFTDEVTVKKILSNLVPIPYSLNYINRVSRTYITTPERSCGTSDDQGLLDEIIKTSRWSTAIILAQKIFVSNGSVYIDYFYDEDEKKIKFRVIGPKHFIPFNDEPLNPTKATAIIKFLGDFPTVHGGEEPRYEAVDDTGFVVFNNKEEIISSYEHNLGVLPGHYFNSSSFLLRPSADLELLDLTSVCNMAIAGASFSLQVSYIPLKLLWNSQIQTEDSTLSHSVDKIHMVEARPGKDPAKAKFEIHDLPLNTKDMHLHVDYVVRSFFRNRSASAPQNTTTERPQSAEALKLESMDLSAITSVIRETFEVEEKIFWKKFAVFFNKISDSISSKQFTKEFDVNIIARDETTVMTKKEVLELIKLKMDAGVITEKQKWKDVYNSLSDEDIEEMMKEAKKEQEAKAQEELNMEKKRSEIAGKTEKDNAITKNKPQKDK